jgi:hypothetical protein
LLGSYGKADFWGTLAGKTEYAFQLLHSMFAPHLLPHLLPHFLVEH